MITAVASFYFDTLNKQEQKRQQENKNEGSFLQRLRNSNYGLSNRF